MSKFKGIGRRVQVGDEATYGTLATMDMNLNYLSEDLKLEVKKEAEETMLAGKTVNGFNLTGYNVSGSITVNLKPENLPLFKYAMVEEADPVLVTTGVYKHTLTLMNPDDAQKPFSATIDRGAKVTAYTGLLVDSMEFKGDARTPINVKLNLKGHAEADGTLNTELPDPSLDTFNALDGIVSIAGSTITDVTSASITVSNGLDDGEATYGSGLYNDEPGHGAKEVKPSIDAFYNASTSGIREADYKTNAYIAESIEWVSPALVAAGHPYSIKFIMPKLAITEASPTISGKETIKISLVGSATANGNSEPLTVEIIDGVATKY